LRGAKRRSEKLVRIETADGGQRERDLGNPAGATSVENKRVIYQKYATKTAPEPWEMGGSDTSSQIGAPKEKKRGGNDKMLKSLFAREGLEEGRQKLGSRSLGEGSNRISSVERREGAN